jgi:hypothetical protein
MMDWGLEWIKNHCVGSHSTSELLFELDKIKDKIEQWTRLSNRYHYDPSKESIRQGVDFLQNTVNKLSTHLKECEIVPKC